MVLVQQNQRWDNQLAVWQMIQELGNDLNGTLDKFTFRVSTERTNLNQFDHTIGKIYDKSNNNSFVLSCVPAGTDPSNRLGGLTFTTDGVPSGFEDVTLDFSCRNYTFIPGHRYLIFITNANMSNSGSNAILFGAVNYNGGGTDLFTSGGLRYANGNTYDYSNNSGSCSPTVYTWGNTSPWHNGCYVWKTPQDDIYFVLTNNSPPPKTPVVFIPGIGGSEMKATQDIVWSKEDGHGGTYSHAYASNEKIWVNQDQATALGDDDYFDVLKLKTDGVTPEAPLNLTGDLTSFGYSDIDSFFSGMGYVKNTNFFVFPYDWRKDIRESRDSLDNLIEQAKTASGQTKVNLVVHSMGGLVARYYISDPNKAAKVNKLIELGVPHLGAPSATKALVYGEPIGRWYFKIINIGVNGNEVKDVLQNLPSHFSLLPSIKYYNFYNNSIENPSPFRDDRDIDNDHIIGSLNYEQTKNLLSNLEYNMTVFGLGEHFHSSLDSLSNQANGTKIYEIVGSSQPTLGQIHETWWITWPVNLIPKTDEIFINGDDTVPLYSASLKNDSQDLSGAYKIYYVDQKHSDLVSANGVAMQTVRKILDDDNSLPVDVKDQKIALEGKQVSVDDADLDIYDSNNNHTGLNSNGEAETNIPNTFYDSIGKTKHVFVKKTAGKTTAKVKSSTVKKVNIKIRNYTQDKIGKITYYNNVPVSNSSDIQFTIDPNSPDSPNLSDGNITISPSSEVTGDDVSDQTPPVTSIQISGTKNPSGIYDGPVTVTLTGSDTESGILRIEYSLDNGQTVNTYTGPFAISTTGQTTIQFRSIDNSGNEEIPQSLTIEIAALPSPTPIPTPTSTSIISSDSSNSSNPSVSFNTSNISTTSIPDTNISRSDILGISFENPSHISDQINVSGILNKQENPNTKEVTNHSTFSNLLIITGGFVALTSLGLIATFSPWNLFFRRHLSFVKPFPK